MSERQIPINSEALKAAYEPGGALRPTLLDKVRQTPDYLGARGRFWEIKNTRADYFHCIVIIEAPYANMHWHSVALAIVSLADSEDARIGKAVINLPGATHEMSVISLNPLVKRQDMLDGIVDGLPHLKTIFTAQMILTDAEARELLLATARDVADAKLPPDKDYLKWWAARFGTSNLKPGWDAFSDKFVVGGKEIIVPLHPLPDADKPSP